MKFRILFLILIIGLASCASPAPEATATPVIAALPTRDQTAPAPTPDSICPNPDCVVIDPRPAPDHPLLFTLPTPADEPRSAWRPPLYPVPWALTQFDHFYFARPIAADQVNWPTADYRYGGVFFSNNVVHTGVDIPAPSGTQVIAAAPGTIVWAGWGLFSGDPGNHDDPYGIAVAIRHDFGYNGEHLYSLYAHMQDLNVMKGQYVNTGDVLGWVGDTGFTTGAHLHFEVRIGENSYFNTRNPELWIVPPQGWGVLAGRVTDGLGQLMPRTMVYVESLETGDIFTARTYGAGAVIADAYYNENVVISDLPAGLYRIRLPEIAAREEIILEIKPGRVTYFTFRGYQGFTGDFPPTPAIPTMTPTPKR
jgi:hypothetical protein